MTNAFVFAAALLLRVSGVDHLRRGSPLQVPAPMPSSRPGSSRRCGGCRPWPSLAVCAATFTLVPAVVAMTASAGASGAGAWLLPHQKSPSGAGWYRGPVLAVLFADSPGMPRCVARRADSRHHGGVRMAREAPLGGWTVARAVLVAVGALIAAGAGGGPIPASSTDVVVVGLAAFALACALAIVPTARQLPARPTLAWSAAGARTSR